MIGSCDLCDRQNVPVSHFDECFAHPEAHACFICQGDSDPDPYGDLSVMDWQTDPSDHSQFATDGLGYFYRVTRVAPVGNCDERSLWSCSWSETKGLRTSSFLYKTVDEAKARMDAIAAPIDLGMPKDRRPSEVNRSPSFLPAAKREALSNRAAKMGRARIHSAPSNPAMGQHQRSATRQV